MVAPELREEIAAAPVRSRPRPFRAEDLDGAWFVVAAATPEVTATSREAAEERHVFVNAVDDKSASAYLGGVLRRGGVTVAVSTRAGRRPSPASCARRSTPCCRRISTVGRGSRMQCASVNAAGRADGAPRPLLLEALNRLYTQKAVSPPPR